MTMHEKLNRMLLIALLLPERKDLLQEAIDQLCGKDLDLLEKIRKDPRIPPDIRNAIDKEVF